MKGTFKMQELKEILEKILTTVQDLNTKFDSLYRGNNGHQNEVKVKSTVPAVEHNIADLCKALTLSEEELRSIVDFESSNFRILQNIPGGNALMKMLNATVCILTIRHFYVKEDSIRSNDLIPEVDNLGIPTNGNLSKALRKEPSCIVARRTSNSKDTVYKITTPGINKGIELLKQIYISSKN